MYRIHLLDSGLRVVTAQYPATKVDYFGIAVNAGSACENEAQHGLAHFVEHCIFKGTTSHTANYILNRIEQVGGELNAYTNKEETVIYTVAPEGFLKRSASLIADIVSNSVFPGKELGKERGVIEEEIDSYLDSPAEAIFDEVDERLFRGTPLAHNILGTKESISRFGSEQCIDWLNHYFTPEQSVVFYSGAMSEKDVLGIVEKAFAQYDRKFTVREDKKYELPATLFNDEMSLGLHHQCHVATAFLIPGIFWERQPEMLLLTNILSGPGMNSWLNMSLREKRGLVYTVEASTSFYTKAGSFIIYYGCDKDDLDLCRHLVTDSLKRISENKISIKELESAKTQYIGQLTISLENRENGIMAAARSLLCRDRILTGDELRNKILAITPDTLIETAHYISPANSSTLLIR